MNEELPTGDSITHSSNEQSSLKNEVSSFLDKQVSRREVLKMGVMAGLGFLLASCAPEGSLEAVEKLIDENDNVAMLNSQFAERLKEFVNDKGIFDYKRIFQNNPELEKYTDKIDQYSQEVSMKYKIQPGVMKLLASSIMVANVGYQESPDLLEQNKRTGLMGLIPSISLPVINNEISNHEYTIENIKDSETSIYLAMVYVAAGLKNIKNDGPNKDLMSLMLANYYGGRPLQEIAKGNTTIEDHKELRSFYNLYNRAITLLGGTIKYAEGNVSENDLTMEEVWNRVVSSWPNTRFAQNKNIFFREAEKYYDDSANGRLGLSMEEYLAIFVSVAKTESNGGTSVENRYSGALGWYQLIPMWEHLEDYNAQFGTNYTYEQIKKNDEISITVGIWTLMRYRNNKDMKELLQMFKGGNQFGYNADDKQWWNSVSQNIQFLLGQDVLAMGVIY